MMDWKGNEEVSLTGWRFYLTKDALDETMGTSTFVIYDGETLRQAIHNFVTAARYHPDKIIGITSEDQRFDGLSKIETSFALKAYNEGIGKESS